jgi:hypothetical protein
MAARTQCYRDLGQRAPVANHLAIGVYGNYAIKLLRLQLDMIRALDQHRRGNKQTVEVRHVHIHSGGQGVVGFLNAPGKSEGGGDREK